MVKLLIFTLLSAASFGSAFGGGGGCPLMVEVEKVAGNKLHVRLKNHASEPLSLRYDQLPWVSGVGGIKVDVLVSGRLQNPAVNIGFNDRLIELQGGEVMEGYIDLDGYKIFYENHLKSDVTMRWRYFIPASFKRVCGDFGGEINNIE